MTQLSNVPYMDQNEVPQAEIAKPQFMDQYEGTTDPVQITQMIDEITNYLNSSKVAGNYHISFKGTGMYAKSITVEETIKGHEYVELSLDGVKVASFLPFNSNIGTINTQGVRNAIIEGISEGQEWLNNPSQMPDYSMYNGISDIQSVGAFFSRVEEDATNILLQGSDYSLRIKETGIAAKNINLQFREGRGNEVQEIILENNTDSTQTISLGNLLPFQSNLMNNPMRPEEFSNSIEGLINDHLSLSESSTETNSLQYDVETTIDMQPIESPEVQHQREINEIDGFFNIMKGSPDVKIANLFFEGSQTYDIMHKHYMSDDVSLETASKFQELIVTKLISQHPDNEEWLKSNEPEFLAGNISLRPKEYEQSDGSIMDVFEVSKVVEGVKIPISLLVTEEGVVSYKRYNSDILD